MKLSLNILDQGLLGKKQLYNNRSPCSLKRCDGPILLHLFACTRANHARSLSVHATFCGSWMQSLLKQHLEKTSQEESVERMEQYHIKFVEKSHRLKRRGHGRKAFV